MSPSAVTKGPLAPTTEAKAKAPAAVHPIPVLDTPLAKGLSFARPALLLGLLAARFDALVSDPVSTLWSALPVVAVIQAVYAVLCLPGAGSQLAKAARKPRPGERKKNDMTGPDPISTALLSLVLTSIATPAVYALFVLFGAPLLDHVPHTILCSAHFALLGLFPVFYARGVNGEALVAVSGASAPLDETFGGLAGAVVGAWLGAVPIPLDWDREWQRWPVTIVVGLYGGSLLGGWASGALLYGRSLRGRA
ncbi:GPI biosynthesis protein family pig-F domain-containing protein [Hirsutella rhossiliensis]|uniref:GPI biosynthesis protein family pig-F domain-containing protein n=1 Tax=Hirsutella rhossiliensis TaxID=111463 RepID=A0A9P8MQ27_9HYPO|nr:GPI biosynthesis protein family pig-F domain-containing protein [Hirsutella rhossiliensis]KAH0959663.1 GPI biosynthesis protein family pig-F domain-containing protein [Hirsutella rhossiliensis]